MDASCGQSKKVEHDLKAYESFMRILLEIVHPGAKFPLKKVAVYPNHSSTDGDDSDLYRWNRNHVESFESFEANCQIVFHGIVTQQVCSPLISDIPYEIVTLSKSLNSYCEFIADLCGKLYLSVPSAAVPSILGYFAYFDSNRRSFINVYTYAEIL